MRTRVAPDPGIAALIQQRSVSFKEALNEAIRAGAVGCLDAALNGHSTAQSLPEIPVPSWRLRCGL